MAIPGLRNIPSEYRDLYEHTYEILTRLRDRQAELTVLMQDEKDAVKRNKYSKERTNINRWVGDVTQAPETFTGIELSKYTNKQLGQRVHTVARSLMDRFNIDPRKASAGGSTQHHADSIMQMQGAYEGASIDTIFRINQSLKEEDIYLGTNAEGRNFYDVDASTHPDFHKLTPEDQVDYSNRWAKVNDMPTATPEERIARIRASSEITQGIARRAAASPLYLGRSQAIQTAAESVQPDIVQQFGQPFDPNITGQAKLERAQAYRGALATFLGGGAKLEFNPQTIQEMMRFPNRLMQEAQGMQTIQQINQAIQNPAARRFGAAVPFVGAGLGAAFVGANRQARLEEIRQNPQDPTLKANLVLDEISGQADRATLAGAALLPTPAAPVGAAMIGAGELTSTVTGVTSLVIDGGRAFIKSIFNPPKREEQKLVPDLPNLR
jgi:hypothetical protein